MHRHPTLTAWNREEDGSYQAEIEGWKLAVSFRPEKGEARRGFSWKAEGPDDKKLESDAVVEEMEHAMADAEEAVEEASGGKKSEEGSSEESDEESSDKSD